VEPPRIAVFDGKRIQRDCAGVLKRLSLGDLPLSGLFKERDDVDPLRQQPNLLVGRETSYVSITDVHVLPIRCLPPDCRPLPGRLRFEPPSAKARRLAAATSGRT
jgi:hypothetical protein